MKITNVYTTMLAMPYPKPIKVSTKVMKNRSLVIVEIETDQGITGTGYMFTSSRGIRVLKAVVDHEIKELIIGENPLYRQKIWQKLWWGLNGIGRKGATIYGISAVDIALWDIAGKMTGQSIHQMLGPTTDKLEAYAGGGWLSMSIDEILQEVNEFKSRGFRAYKMRVGSPDWRQDLERVKAVREAFGNDIEIMIDVNQGLDVPSATILGRQLEKQNIFWFEEPVHADNIDGLAQIASALDVRVAAGESEYGRYGFKDLINRKAIDVLQIDVQRVGGVTEWIRVANTADAWDLKVTPHLFWEISVQLTCAVPNAIYIEYMNWLDDFFEELPIIENGYVHVWDKPGHGLIFRNDVKNKYKID